MPKGNKDKKTAANNSVAHSVGGVTLQLYNGPRSGLYYSQDHVRLCIPKIEHLNANVSESYKVILDAAEDAKISAVIVESFNAEGLTKFTDLTVKLENIIRNCS